MEDQNSQYILPPKEPTVEEAKRFVSATTIEIVVSSTIVGFEKDRDGKITAKRQVKKVIVKNESELKPELVMSGPTRRGECNIYVGIDGHSHVFNAQTGEAIGSAMQPIANPMRVKLEALAKEAMTNIGPPAGIQR